MTLTTCITGPRAIKFAYCPIMMLVVANESQLLDGINRTLTPMFSDKDILVHYASNYTK